jgi:hypothetical protein
MLVGQREELARGRGTGRAQGGEQSGHHAPEQLICLQVQGRSRQPGVALVQERGTQNAQTIDRSFQQLSNDRLGGGVPGQGVQVTLDDDGGRFFVHGRGHRRTRRRQLI